MASQTSISTFGDSCCICKQHGGDIRVVNCGCTMHVCCTPLDLVFGSKADKTTTCPGCNAGVGTSGICLLPLSFQDIDRAIELKTNEANNNSNNNNAKGKKGTSSKTNENGNNGKRGFQVDLYDQVVYSVLSQGRRHRADNSEDYQRTGRWTDEETAFVDHLVWAFDQGILPVPNGMKLNQCLSDFLLCKLSRLTKKMKNAKLSSRSFARKPRTTQAQKEKYARLFSLQGCFLESITSESLRLELRFNLTRQWRIQFSNICLQVGYPLRKDKFMASLDDLERRVARLEGTIKKRRRLDMGAALGLQIENSGHPQHDQAYPSASSSVGQTAQMPYHRSASLPDLVHKPHPSSALQNHHVASSLALYELGQYPQGMGMTNSASFPDHQSSQPGIARRERTFSEDFDSALMTLMQPDPTKAEEVSLSTQASGEKIQSSSIETTHNQDVAVEDRPRDFMEAIEMYMEANKLPFVHADAWVPSHVAAKGGGQQIRLLHAGCVTQRNTSEKACSILNSFAEYSKTFSFDISSGLPGRVYSSGADLWESHVNDVRQSVFARSSGANTFGLKSAVGFPLGTNGVGRMVIVLYSFDEVQQDSSIVKSFAAALEKYSPEPKWKLVIEVGRDALPIRKRNASSINSDMETSSKGGKASKLLPSQIGTPLASALSSPSMSPRPNSELSQIFPDIAVDSPATSTLGLGGSGGRLTPLSLRQPSRTDAIEQNIIDLLGDQIPLSAATGPKDGVSYSSADISNFVPHCMAIRLMLLRAPDARSENENQIIEVLKSSYQAFTNGNKRSGPDLAMLLVRDWICLSGSMAASNPTPGQCGPPPQIQQQQQRIAAPMARPPAPRNGAAAGSGSTLPIKPLQPPGSRLSRPPGRQQMLPGQHPRRVSVPGEPQPLQFASTTTQGRRQSIGHLPLQPMPPTAVAPPSIQAQRRQSTGGIGGDGGTNKTSSTLPPAARQQSTSGSGQMQHQPLPSAPPLPQYQK